MLDIIKFKQFTEGTRVLLLTKRGKDGGKKTKGDRVAKKLISNSHEEFVDCLERLEAIRKSDERIYSSVNSRSIEKAIHEFKSRQLDADYYDDVNRHNFYFDIKNRWISCLMKPSCRAETIFLIDIDDIIKKSDSWNISIIDKHLKEIGVKEIIRYNTKNGIHILTEPFNPALWDSVYGDIKKDALLLISF